jgi:predicted nucleotidyltransferase
VHPAEESDAAAAVRRLRDAARDGSLAAVARRHGVSVLAGFGSAVTGDAPHGEPRDVDVAVGFRVRPGDGGLALIGDLVDLADSGLIDMVQLDAADVVLVEEALATGEIWFEDVGGEAASRHLRASLLRMDSDWMRRLDLALMAEQP